MTGQWRKGVVMSNITLVYAYGAACLVAGFALGVLFRW